MAPRYGFNAKTLIEQGRVTNENFNKLKEWCGKEKLPELSDEQMVLFLLSCYNELEATQRTIHLHFKHKVGAPNLFFNRDVNAEDVQRGMKICSISILPARTSSNDAIIFFKLQDTSYSGFNLDCALKVIFMVGELLLYQDPPDGLVILIDATGVSLFHIAKLRVGPLRTFFRFVQEGYACKIKQIHVLNTVYFIDKIMYILKPLMNKNLYEMIKFHSSNMDMNIFFDKYLPINCLPEDYGGILPDQATLTMQTYNAFQGMRQFYKAEEDQLKAYTEMQ